MTRNKKGQTEIIGLVIIVIIIVIAGSFFFIRALRPRESHQSKYENPKLAQSFLNTLMNTKTEKNVIVSDIIKDCYSPAKNDLCGSSTTSDCCNYAYATISNALDHTLGTWQKEYRLIVRKQGYADKIEDLFSSEKCHKGAPQGQPGFYYIPPSPPIVVTLMICDV
ncbi:hypothetical protein HN789_04550 [archaeon]|jgi:flagellin-like protein|nr:hypothetical protein [archaeon]MBT6107473.1 hypothetical protein [Campylobacteraceae bacterium]MBT4022460.1 hypothetical protein [archaeon]MBT4272615.1 hypothetical protein [archaeon]MBT4461219.1 hypothetical protein [archaeon]